LRWSGSAISEQEGSASGTDSEEQEVGMDYLFQQDYEEKKAVNVTRPSNIVTNEEATAEGINLNFDVKNFATISMM